MANIHEMSKNNPVATHFKYLAEYPLSFILHSEGIDFNGPFRK